MGFLDFLIGKKAEERKEEAKAEKEAIEMAGVLRLMHEAKDAEIEAARGKIMEMQKEIISHASHLQDAASKLSSSPGAIPAADMIKESLVRQIRASFSSLPGPNAETVSAIESFHETVSKKINASITPKQAFVLSNYYSEEADALVKKMKEIHRKLDEYKAFVGGSPILYALEEAERLTERYHGLMKRMQDLDGRAGEVGNEMEVLLFENERLGEELGNLEKEGGWKILQSMEDSRKRLQEEEEKERLAAKSRVSERKKELKSLWHYCDSNRLISKELSASFRDSIEGSGNLEGLAAVFGKLEFVEQDIISQDDIRRLKDVIHKFEGSMEKIRARRVGVEEKLKGMGWLSSKKESLENEISSVRKKIGEKEREQSEIAENRKRVAEGMEEAKEEMKKVLGEKAGIQADIR